MVIHKTALVTGGNGYLGSALCKRLMDNTDENVRLTIIITSRHFRGATEAVRNLQAYVFEKHPNRPQPIEFDYLLFDQCDMISVLNAAREIKKRYTSIEYMFFNSSHSQMTGIDKWQAAKDFVTEPIRAFTVGTFKIQGKATKTADGMGSSFQANVFAPWFLVQEILPVLKPGAKLIWISTSISSPEFFDKEDLGVEESHYSYEASKYELELLHRATYKDLLAKHGIQSWILQPGVFKSTTFVPTLDIFSYLFMLFMFYVCRLCGSPYHCIHPEIAANAPLFLALEATPDKDDMSVKYGSSVTRWGKEKLITTEFNPDEADVKAVHSYVENLRQQWKLRLADQIVEREDY
ncbi:3-keto-steroid reductase [Wickerhamiella sorbophila]|uniref:3beta-hydroxysteroid 3-dehydrogenase n=1 Tax=Wickerhamiella sorbophila TaxID=45607 RepID=A0A2T0FDJ1_9ASCO|nr:3-keto-steroid reductase [Wickerhamiella sorbophila]PRT53062.1 3-keto-steroid reductase [Wickerhamiella sorbophila]